MEFALGQNDAVIWKHFQMMWLRRPAETRPVSYLPRVCELHGEKVVSVHLRGSADTHGLDGKLNTVNHVECVLSSCTSVCGSLPNNDLSLVIRKY